MAVVRARLENCPIVLARRRRRSKPTSMPKPAVRMAQARPPLRRRGHAGGQAYRPAQGCRRAGPVPLAARCAPLCTDTLAAGEQALLFLNRRGYAPLTLCKLCGHKETCRNCSAWMVEHRYRKRLVCHHCAFESPIPERCPQCAAEGSLVACGPGVERIEEEVRAPFPRRASRLPRATRLPAPPRRNPSSARSPKATSTSLIGTQIVAKGHHFPQLTLAGMIDADLGGSAGDPRAAERSFQLLHQVAGRSGRGEKPGHGADPDPQSRRCGDSGVGQRAAATISSSRRRARANAT